METVTLEANERKDITKATRNALKREGRVPGVYYSKHSDTISIDVLGKKIHPMVFTSKANLISLKIEGQEEMECIIKDIQFDPVTDEIVHFDLLGLTRGEKIQLEIPVRLTGNSIGVKEEGGVLQHLLHKLDVECLPKHIPESIEVDISELAIGDSIQVSDLSIEDLVLLNPGDAIVVTVSHQRVVEEEVEVTDELAEDEEIAEPEVIGKGKPEEEEEKEKDS